MKFNLNSFTLYSFIEKLSDVYENKTCISFIDDNGISYAAFFERVLNYASFLAGKGIKKRDRVLIYGRPSVNLCAAFFASSIIGGIPVIVHNALSPVILKKTFNNLNYKLAFVDKDLKSLAEELTILPPKLIFNMAETMNKDNTVKKDALNKIIHDVDKDDIACIFLSSGTTGAPRACAFTHYNILSAIDTVPDNYNFFSEHTRCLNLLSPAHLHGFMQGILAVFYAGGTVYFTRHFSTKKKLFEDITRLKPTLLLAHNNFYENIYTARIVPVLTGQMFHHSISRAFFTRKYLYKRLANKIAKIIGTNIECLYILGSRLDPELELFFLESNLPFAYGYVISECASVITLQHSDFYKTGSSGAALEKEQIRILNPDEETGIGRIEISSPSLLYGYKRRIGFYRPVRGQDSWFATKDRGFTGRYGELYITGREENGIKLLNGLILYPEEIEDLFREEHYIKEVKIRLDHDILVAEVYPDYTFISKRMNAFDTDSIDSHVMEVVNRLKDHINIKIPSIFQISRIKIRREPFEKNPYGSVII